MLLHLQLLALRWLQPVWAQFAPVGDVPKQSGATEIVPDAGKVLEGVFGTSQADQGGFFLKRSQLISLATGYLMMFMGFISVLALIYAGFLWVTSAANPDNIAKAKTIVGYVVIGLLLASFAYAIVRTITYVGGIRI